MRGQAVPPHPCRSFRPVVASKEVKRRLYLLAVVIGVLASCKDPTQVRVLVRSNVSYAAGMNLGVWASHSAAEGTPVAESAEPWLADGELGDLYVTPQPGRRDGPLTLRVVLGLRGKPAAECANAADLRGCIVAQRKLSFVPHTRLKVPVVLYAACEGVKCGADETCSYLGTCVPAQVDPRACATDDGCTLPGEPPFVPGTQTGQDAGGDALADAAPSDAAVDTDVGPADAGDAGVSITPLEIAAGGAYSCAVATIGSVEGSLKCWGGNNGGTLGLGDLLSRGGAPGQMGANLPVIDLGPGARVVEVAAGFDAMVCARLSDGRVKCWGRNDSGRLGVGDPQTRGDEAGEMGANLSAIDLGPGRSAKQISLGVSHACAMLDDATLKCWGVSAVGALGLGDTQVRGFSLAQMGANLPALDLGPGRTARQLSAGGTQTCARLDNDSVKCWGSNDLGQLGLGDVQSRGAAPGQMGASLPAVDLGLGRTVRQVSVGLGCTCVVLDNGSVKCWGANTRGELGTGDLQERGSSPGEMGDNLQAVDLGVGRTALQVASGTQFVCALLDDRTVKCWGRNDLGQLGLGDQQDRGGNPGEMGAALPTVDLGPGRKALQIAAGTHACAKLDDGNIKCWGSNGSGELGLGDLLSRGDKPGQMGASLPAVQLQ